MNLHMEEIISIFVSVVNVLRKQTSFDDEKFCEDIKNLVEESKEISEIKLKILSSLLNHPIEKQCDPTEEEESDDDIEPDYYYSNYTNDPFAGVDWGDPSTFNKAAWDQINDRD